jgi:hypothetical protein
MGSIIVGAILSRIKALFYRKSVKKALPYVGQQLFSQLDSLKFLCCYDEQGEARLFPVVQATSAGADRIVLSGIPFGKQLRQIPEGAKVSILCLNLKMECVLVKRSLYERRSGDRSALYNSMPPKMEYVYPRKRDDGTGSLVLGILRIAKGGGAIPRFYCIAILSMRLLQIPCEGYKETLCYPAGIPAVDEKLVEAL